MILGIFLSALSAPILAQNKVEQCPSQITETGLQLLKGPVGWVAYQGGTMRLEAAGFMAGPPSTKTDLKPWSSEEIRGARTAIWKFDPDSFLDSDGLWLSCAYGKAQNVTLSRKIRSDYAECRVAYSTNKGDPSHHIVVTCK
jgi:hypothetical protein